MVNTVTSTPNRADGPEIAKRHRVSIDDWLMTALAVVAVGLLTYRTFWTLRPDTARLITRIDWAMCGVFFVEFLWRWRSAGFSGRFVKVNWYDLVGMVPVSHLAFRAFRLLRVWRIAVVMTKSHMPLDRSVGEELAHRAMGRFGGVLINVIKKPLTVAVLEEVVSVLRTGHYARNVAAALEENQVEIREMVLEKIKHDRQVGKLKVLPFYDDVVCAVSDASLRVILEMLADPRTDELISDMLRENIEQIRQAVRGGHHRDLPDFAPADRI